VQYKILYKYEFLQAHCVELLKRSRTKFSLPFLDIPTSFYEFWNLNCFLLFKTNRKDLKDTRTAGRKASWASAWRPGPAKEASRMPAQVTRGPHTWQHGGLLAGGPVYPGSTSGAPVWHQEMWRSVGLNREVGRRQG
jgi:hypothetical protein